MNIEMTTQRSLWDSLYVKQNGSNDVYELHTTYPIENYVLPEDIFVAICLCGPSKVGQNEAIAFYAPRASKHDTKIPVQELLMNDQVEGIPPTEHESSELERTRKPYAVDRGRSAHATNRDDPHNKTEELPTKKTKVNPYKISIFGRGDTSNTLWIAKMHPWVTKGYVDGFIRSLLQSGDIVQPMPRISPQTEKCITWSTTISRPPCPVEVNLLAFREKIASFLRRVAISLEFPELDPYDDPDLNIHAEIDHYAVSLAEYAVRLIQSRLQQAAIAESFTGVHGPSTTTVRALSYRRVCVT